MDPLVQAALVTGGVSAVTGGIGQSDGSLKQYKMQKRLNLQAFRRQKFFARNSLQMRVRDGKKAGLSPLAAIGAGGTSIPSIQTGHAPQTTRDTAGGSLSILQTMLDYLMRDKLADKQIKLMELEHEGRQLAAGLRPRGGRVHPLPPGRRPTSYDPTLPKPAAAYAAEWGLGNPEDYEPGDLINMGEETVEQFESFWSTVAWLVLQGYSGNKWIASKLQEQTEKVLGRKLEANEWPNLQRWLATHWRGRQENARANAQRPKPPIDARAYRLHRERQSSRFQNYNR